MVCKRVEEQEHREEHVLSTELRSELESFWTGTIQWDEDMAAHCTLRAGGRAEALLTASSGPELALLMNWLRSNAVQWKVIGRGSNILVQSRGFSGVLIVLGEAFGSIDILDDPAAGEDVVKVRVGAGCSVARLVGWTCRQALMGLEFMIGIPGSVGGAVSMNAGAWGSEIGGRVECVSYVDEQGLVQDACGDDLSFSYRRLQLKKGFIENAVITGAVLRLEKGMQKEIIALCRNYLKSRRAKQPVSVASAGSFFKNPAGDSAGRLIDDAGLKGLQRGNAMVSTKHANFLVNTGNATADDIVELMKEVQQRVYRHAGVMLEPEVHLL